MKAISTIGDLKESGLLCGMYGSLFKYYRTKLADPYRRWDDGSVTHKPQAWLEREFLAEDVYILGIMRDVVNDTGFGKIHKGKKYEQLKIIFDNLGIPLEDDHAIREDQA